MIGGLNVVSLLVGLAILYAVTTRVFHLSTTVIIVLEVIAFVVFVVSNLVLRRSQ
jgi:L-asparagine transporter-like permease